MSPVLKFPAQLQLLSGLLSLHAFEFVLHVRALPKLGRAKAMARSVRYFMIVIQSA